MTINVRWNGGIEVDGEDTALILDPISYNPECLHALITHAHSDHSMGLYLPFRDIYSTKETMDLANIYHPTKSKGWHPINLGSKFRVGEFEVKVHNAGHILGSVLYEVAMDEGNFVYTGDLNTVKTLMMEAAEPTPCDILAIDATFGSPSFIFPSREDLSTEIVRWAISSLRKNMIPTFQTDSMGNAQEIISILNKATNIPIVTHPRISAVNTVYGAYGYSLNYLDARSEEADELLSECSCALILPKGASAPKKAKPNIALASGWALYIKDDRKPLPLSDHADFINLIKFISEAHPDIVLTFHGGKRNVVLAEYVERKLGIEARPISMGGASLTGRKDRLTRCEMEVLRVVKVRGFVYELRWICDVMRRRGYSENEVRVALKNLVKRGVLRQGSKDHEFEME